MAMESSAPADDYTTDITVRLRVRPGRLIDELGDDIPRTPVEMRRWIEQEVAGGVVLAIENRIGHGVMMLGIVDCDRPDAAVRDPLR